MKNRQWVLKQRPEGQFKVADFEERVVEVPGLKEGEALLKNLYLSFDPTQRGWAAMDTYLPAVPLGDVMRAMGIGQVIESKNKQYRKGDLIFGLIGWQEYFVIPSVAPQTFQPTKMSPHIDIPLLIAFVTTGLTAYAGMTIIGKVKRGDTVVVSGAAGATGSIAGQIGKLKGARVIGIAGGIDKCRWLKEEAHFDEAINYKSENVESRLGELCPNGIDLFFDNVGGEILDAVLMHIAQNAKIVLCGQISQYDKALSQNTNKAEEQIYGIKGVMKLIHKHGKMEGYLATEYVNRAMEAVLCLNQWVEDGKILQEIDLQEGFQNIPQTLIRIFEGKNIGKQMLKLSDPPLPLQKNFIGRLIFRGLQKLISKIKG